MSQKSTRKGSVAKNTYKKPNGSSNDSEKSRQTVALSPTRFSRIQEKHKLQDLNNRLAAYIERVKFLETENLQLTQELHSSQEGTKQEVSNVKVLYESELDNLRNALDQEVKQKNRVELECRRKSLELEELNIKLNNAIEDLNKTVPYITQFHELNTKNSQTLIDIKNLKEANQKLTQELTIEKENMSDAIKKLDEEILQRVTAENKLQSLKEGFKFKEEVHNQLLNDARTIRHTEIINEVDGRLTKVYENKLQNELQILRQQAKEDVIQNKRKISELFHGKLQNLENEVQRKNKAIESAIEDVSSANGQIEHLAREMTDLLSSKNGYLTKIAELEQKRENQRIRYLSDIKELEQQLTAMQDDMSLKAQEYQDLMDIKIALDLEISAYRKLLESEERRLSITANTSVLGSPRGEKRKWFQCDEPENEYSNVITASSTGDIDISEVCPDGRFIKLYNKGSKEVALGGFEIVRTTDKQNNSTVFKFHPSVELRAGNIITVWSQTACNQIPEPGSIIMNTQSWVVGDLMATILLNTEGQEIATHELKKQASLSLANVNFGDYETELLHQQDNSQTGSKCVVM